MHEANTALLDILVDNSVIIPSFQNRTSTSMERWAKRLFVGFEKDLGFNQLNYRLEHPEVADFAVFTSYTAGILKGH